MSKQSEAKARQNYRPTPMSCGTCIHFGGFKVKKLASCDEWDPALPKTPTEDIGG